MIRLIGLFIFCASLLSAGRSVVVKAEKFDPELERMSVDHLIDLLQFETVSFQKIAGGIEHRIPALRETFLPISVRTHPEGTMAAPEKSAVMTELVRRGVDALPALLRNLSNAKPTRIVETKPDIGSVGLSDFYDPRYMEPGKIPDGVNTAGASGADFPFGQRAYVYTIGDLCFIAARLIVNRHHRPPNSSGSLRVSTINSPTHYPGLAKAMQADWIGLTKEQHAESLRGDALERNNGGLGYHAIGALPRLLFYYPEVGRELADRFLRRAVVLNRLEVRTTEQVLCSDQQLLVQSQLASFDWPGLDELFYQNYLAARKLGSEARGLMWACAQRLKISERKEEIRNDIIVLMLSKEQGLKAEHLNRAQTGLLNQEIHECREFLNSF